AIDQAWVDLLQALIVDLEAEFDVRAKVLDHDVGILRQPVQHLETFGILEVERDAALVAVEVLEIGAVPRAAEPAIALDRFDLDDLGAPIGELPYAGRAGADTRQIDDLEAGTRELAHDASLLRGPLRVAVSCQTLSAIPKRSR